MVRLSKRRQVSNTSSVSVPTDCQETKKQLSECLDMNKTLKEKDLICKSLIDKLNECIKYTNKPQINII